MKVWLPLSILLFLPARSKLLNKVGRGLIQLATKFLNARPRTRLLFRLHRLREMQIRALVECGRDRQLLELLIRQLVFAPSIREARESIPLPHKPACVVR